MSPVFLNTCLILFFNLSLLFSCNGQNKSEQMNNDSSLQYIYRISDDTINKSPLLIVLHGHGSNETDLFSLTESVPKSWNVVAVRGPYKLAENSFRWYDVKMIGGKISINLEQEEQSRKKLLELISILTNKFEIDTSRIVVAGFSQGANMAQSLGLGNPNLIAGFAVFSGRYVEEFEPYINRSIDLREKKAFISHGTNDNMLPKTFSTENKNKLMDLGLKVTYSEDSNAHSISPKQLNDFLKWLHNFN